MIHSSSLEVVAKLASIGAGVAILPSRVALREPTYKLKLLFAKGPVFEDKVCLIYRPDASRSLAFKTAMRAIEASFKGESA
jgi:DNA-binding transcriptional LysR family regulator